MLNTEDQSTKKNVIGIISGVIIGLIVTGIATYFTLFQKIITLETKLDYSNTHQSSYNQDRNLLNSDTISNNNIKVSPDKLISIIKEQQNLYVKESTGTMDYQCFTDRDMQNFIDKNVPNIIRTNLLKSNEYLSVIIVVKRMDPINRQNLLQLAQNTFKPTFAEFGGISKKGQAQTEAGQNAEKMIAQAVTDLTKNLLKKTETEINSMMN
jgi:hypothetical protein